MELVTTYLMAKGGFAFSTLCLLWSTIYLWRENKRLVERLETKSDKQAEINQETARQMTQAFATVTKRRRTRALGEPVK